MFSDLDSDLLSHQVGSVSLKDSGSRPVWVERKRGNLYVGGRSLDEGGCETRWAGDGTSGEGRYGGRGSGRRDSTEFQWETTQGSTWVVGPPHP